MDISTSMLVFFMASAAVGLVLVVFIKPRAVALEGMWQKHSAGRQKQMEGIWKAYDIAQMTVCGLRGIKFGAQGALDAAEKARQIHDAAMQTNDPKIIRAAADAFRDTQLNMEPVLSKLIDRFVQAQIDITHLEAYVAQGKQMQRWFAPSLDVKNTLFTGRELIASLNGLMRDLSALHARMEVVLNETLTARELREA